MHYHDKEHVKQAYCDIVVYKHEDLSTSAAIKARRFYYQVTSVCEAKYFSAWTIGEIARKPHRYNINRLLKDLPAERPYLVRVTCREGSGFDVAMMGDLSHSDNPFHGLH